MSSIKVEEKSPLHPSNSGPSLTSNTNVSSSQQQPHRVNANQQQSLHQPQQQRPPRSGPMQRGIIFNI